MRLRAIGFLSMLFLLVGCATLEVRREVRDNIFTSTFPPVSIKVDDSFKYIGDLSKLLKWDNIDGSKRNRHRISSHLFVLPDGIVASKVVVIKIQHVSHGGYISDIFRHTKGVEKSTVDINGKRFQYCTSFITPSNDGYLAKHIEDSGYTVPSGLLKRYIRRYGPQKNILVQVMFLETIPDDALARMGWTSRDSLYSEQLEYLKGFNERADNAFELLSMR